MRYEDDKRYKRDFVNGEGIRRSVFCTGCPHHCKGCFNEKAWDFGSGDLWNKDSEDEVIKDLSDPKISGLSLLGGEPFCNTDGFIPLIKRVKNELSNKDIWVWSGYTFEEIMKDENKKEMLLLIDVLIDGKFEEKFYDPKLNYRGSSNQRIIDVKKSLKENKIINYELNKF